MFKLHDYQQTTLTTLDNFFIQTRQHGAKTAFVLSTDRPYNSVKQLPGLPYVCIRIPTGGGKTLVACHSLALAAKSLLEAEHAVCLWLVPSSTIRDQTISALKDRKHPYREALDAQFSGGVTVLTLAEALYIQRGMLAGETCIIVSTLAASRVEEKDERKVYESSGALQHHFTNLSPALESQLEKGVDGVVPYSLANVLRLWRPVIIMDEAHNARTQLSFDTLARFNPSCILEFTATPETTHRPDQGKFASNILAHVSAAELKLAEMVKLPIRLETRPDWKEVISEALAKQRELEATALEEEKLTGEYIRPIVLFQAQSKNQTKETLTVDVVKKTLIDEFKVPSDQIAVATGETRGIESKDLFAKTCPIRFIITVQALKEGWDCSFAYVFCSVADISSPRYVEQLLGRILRLPQARLKKNSILNFAYAFAASPQFITAAQSLKDALVENGFERIEADKLITSKPSQGTFFQGGNNSFTTSRKVPERPKLDSLPADIKERVTFDDSSSVLTVAGELNEFEKVSLQKCFDTSKAKEAITEIFQLSRGKQLPIASDKPETRPDFKVPQLCIRVKGQLDLFDETQFLSTPWKLSDCDVALSIGEFPTISSGGKLGEIDVGEAGKVEVKFIDQIHNQLQLLGFEPGWDLAGLTNWFDRQIPHPDIARTESSLFIHRLLSTLVQGRDVSVAQLAQQKYRLRSAIAAKIADHRRTQALKSYNRVLFSQDAGELEVSPELCFSYTEDLYAPNSYYDGSYHFKKHYFDVIGDLKAEGEEFECATFLDQHNKVKFWVRNLERKPDSSFWLQTSTDKFYPDFVAQLNDGTILVVEYKGEDRWSNDDSTEKRAVGALWAERSDGRCLFIMPKGRDLASITASIAAASKA